jgi:hypothetical protein
MATYTATTKFGSGYQPSIGQVAAVGATWSIGSTVVLGTADVLAGPIVPAGARIIGVFLGARDADSGTSLTLDVGDSADDNRLVSAATSGQAGGISTALVAATGIGYQYTAATELQVTPAAAATGSSGTAGFVTLMVHYVVEEAAS